MSRTHRRHESLTRLAKRGPKNPPDDDAPRLRLKTNKQLRRTERLSLRKEYP